MGNNRLPDFLIIGAGKSGTTSLDKYLSQHSNVFMSRRKEPNFFAYLNVDPQIYQDIPETYEHCMNSIREWDDYYSLFKSATENQIIGETSNTYLTVGNALPNIKKYLPDTKLIAILRNPVDRLFSRYLHLARDNRLGFSINQVFDKDSIWWKRNDLINEGFYYKNLIGYYENFGRDKILVLLFEDLVKNPDETMKSVFDFLNINQLNDIKTNIEYNPSGIIRNKFVDFFVGNNSIILKGLKHLLPESSYENLKDNNFLQKAVIDFRKSNLDKPKLDTKMRHRIYSEIYREDINDLEELIGKDLSNWKHLRTDKSVN